MTLLLEVRMLQLPRRYELTDVSPGRLDSLKLLIRGTAVFPWER